MGAVRQPHCGQICLIMFGGLCVECSSCSDLSCKHQPILYIYISTRTYKYVQNKLLHWSHDCDMAPVETKVEQPSSSQLVFFPYLQFVWRHYAAIFKRLSLGALVSAIHQTDYQRTFLYVGINCHSRLSCWTIKPAVN
jgi:hypothetical protein